LLDIPLEQQKKLQERVNPRLSEQLVEALNQFCEKNNIKSRSKVVKEALAFVLNKKSNIDFGIKTDYVNEKRKTLEFKDEIKTRTNCPHCTGRLRLDPELLPIKEKKIIESDTPGYRCGDPSCLKAHPNPNYKEKPKGKCSLCFQFCRTNSGDCPICFSKNAVRPINDFELSRIPNPKEISSNGKSPV